ncbi:ATP-binding protein [Mycolicibacterium frederiksbergense]|nr:helicase HerA-like domain-containing protein [Mycolicibacterium frederiksbergense]
MTEIGQDGAPAATINIADDFTMPLDSVTSTFAILGKKGRGKTHTASVLAEELMSAGCLICVIDPTGVWHGLRSSADGRAAGFPVIIIGGEHADVALRADQGAAIAELIVKERFPAVVDLSLLRKAERRTFATDFLETLYWRNREPLHLIIDEADEFAPQRAPAGVERLLGATEDIVRRGRVKGLGVTLCSQRAAALHKTVLSQLDSLIALGVTAPQDVSAISDWVAQHAEEGQARQVRQSLPSLPIGQAWVWSPEWLGVTQLINVRRRHTFDSSATPKAGARRHTASTRAPVDVERLRRQLDNTTTTPVAGDGTPAPSADREIQRLRSELEAERARAQQVVHVEVPVLSTDDLGALTCAVEQLRAFGETISRAADQVENALAASPAVSGQQGRAAATPAKAPELQCESPPKAKTTAEPAGRDDDKLKLAEREILTVLAQHGQRTSSQIALLTGRSHKGGGFRNALSSLRTGGLIEGRGDIAITAAGLDALGSWEHLPPPGPELIAWWAQHLDKAPRMILQYLARHPHRDIPIAEIAEATEYSPVGGGFRNALSRLRSLNLASGRGELHINADLLGAP